MKNYICKFAVASCVDNGGIYKYALYDGGKAELIGKISMPSPMFFEVNGEKMTVLLRAPFENSDDSGICVYDLDSGEALTKLISTRGTVGCHIAVYGDTVYCANYVSGSVFMTPDKLVVHTGCGVNKQRQEAPHVHSTFFSPDKKYVLSCDLGTDEVYVYDRALNEISRARVPDGNGPRHLCFSADGEYVYCINEMSATLSVFAYSDGKLTYIKDTDIKPASYSGQGKGSAIKMSKDGKRLYMSERGSETVVLADVDGENVSVRAHADSHGSEPRDISLIADECFLVCTNQFSDNISVYEVSSDGTLALTDALPISAPLCVCEL